MSSIERLEASLARVEAMAATLAQATPPQSGGDGAAGVDAELVRRHERLKDEMRAAITELDMLIGEADG